ncbi:MAG: M48 family metallopeptidase [Solirubrobacterales bacterium]|nr:M48 family metallopeptidase [Solirubrobacterales bacterium]
MSHLTDSGIDLSRKGVIWLEGQAIPVEPTGTGKAVARLVKPKRKQVVEATFGQMLFEEPDPGVLSVGGGARKQVLGAIDRWYRREARQQIGQVVEIEADRLDLHPEKISIRDQKTRWGSCSTSGMLSFNWRLVVGPHHALRYVVIHELIHIRHHDHSRRFWAALAEALPDWKYSAAWLRQNERALTTYRPKI